MLKYFFVVIVVFASLGAQDIPQDDKVHMKTLSNGVKVWIRENPTPPQLASLRVLWKKNGIPSNFALDCPSEDRNELEDFFEYCQEKIDDSCDSVSVIAVGDFNENELISFIDSQFHSLPELKPRPLMESVKILPLSKVSHIELSLTYPTAIYALKTLEDLQRQWMIYCFQEIVQTRFVSSLQLSGGTWIPQQESKFLLPRTFCLGKARCAEENSLEVLGGFLLEIQKIRTTGFEEEELKAVQSKIQKGLLSMVTHVHKSGILASYYAEQCTLGMGCPSYDFFLAKSFDIVQRISLRDLHESIGAFLIDGNRQVEMVCPPEAKVGEAQIHEVMDLFQADAFVLVLTDDKEPTRRPYGEISSDAPDPYSLLAISDTEAEIIWKIIDTMANHNVIKLALKKKDMEKKGRKINHVHPLRFLGTIFSNPYLRECMREVRDSYFKWEGFLGGVKGRMEEEYSQNNLLLYVQGFSQSVKANPDQVRMYLQKKDWEGLCKYLVKE